MNKIIKALLINLLVYSIFCISNSLTVEASSLNGWVKVKETNGDGYYYYEDGNKLYGVGNFKKNGNIGHFEINYYNSGRKIITDRNDLFADYYLETSLLNNGKEIYSSAWLQKNIKDKVSALSSDGSFIFITDMHFYANTRRSAELIRRVNSSYKSKFGNNLRFVLLGGDYETVNKTEDYLEYDAVELLKFVNSLQSKGIDVFAVRGNHDFRMPNESLNKTYVRSQKYAYYTLVEPLLKNNKKNHSVKQPSNAEGKKLYYYFDEKINNKNVRFFVLDVYKSPNTDGVQYLDDEQLNWFVTSLKKTNNSYIVVTTHPAVDINISTKWLKTREDANVIPGRYNGIEVIHVIEAAINNRKKVSSYKKMDGTNVDVDYDFSNTSNYVLAHISGHNHQDRYSITDNVLSIMTTSDAAYSNDYDELCLVKGNSRETCQIKRERGTVNEHAFDIITLDVNKKKIYATRIGYGEDREWDFVDKFNTNVKYDNMTNGDIKVTITLNEAVKKIHKQNGGRWDMNDSWTISNNKKELFKIYKNNVKENLRIYPDVYGEIKSKNNKFGYYANVVVDTTNNNGDVDGDGKIGTKDYILVRKHILNISLLSGNEKKRADVNLDGKISSLDYIFIRKKIVGML